MILWVGAIIGFALLYKLLGYIHYRRLLTRFGAKPYTNVRPSHFWGLPLVIGTSIVRNKGRFPENIVNSLDICKNPEVRTWYSRAIGKEIILTADPENIKAILATQFNDFGIGLRYTVLKPLLGRGIFTSSGEHWKASRSMLRPQFSRDNIAHVDQFEPHLQLLIKHIKKHNGQKFDLQNLFSLFTVDAATEFLFGQSVHSLHDESIGMVSSKASKDGREKFAESFSVTQNYITQRAILQNYCWLVNPKKFRDAIKDLHSFADYYVELVLKLSPAEIEAKGGYSLLTELAKHSDDHIMIRDQLFNLLLAGRNTTASLLDFIFFELSRNPVIFARLKSEVRTRFGSGEDASIEDITFETLKHLDFLRAVINETLRMYPIVSVNFRSTVKDTSLPRGGGPDGQSPIVAKKDTVTIFSTYALQRNKLFYGEDAEEWKPDRWFDAKMKNVGWNFMPFLGGPRICIGQQFALTEVSYVVTRLLQEFDNLESYNERYPPFKGAHVSMKLTEGCHVAMY